MKSQRVNRHINTATRQKCIKCVLEYTDSIFSLHFFKVEQSQFICRESAKLKRNKCSNENT